MTKHFKVLWLPILILLGVVSIIICNWYYLISRNALGPVVGALIGITGSIIGAYIGSTLTFERSILWQEKKEKLRRLKNLDLIIAELKINLSMIDGKQKGLARIIRDLHDSKLPIGWEIKFFNTAYKQFITDLDVSAKERNALQIIYEQTIIFDDFIQNYEKDLLENLKYAATIGKQSKPYEIFHKKAGYLKVLLEDIERNIKNYLTGNADDTFEYKFDN